MYVCACACACVRACVTRMDFKGFPKWLRYTVFFAILTLNLNKSAVSDLIAFVHARRMSVCDVALIITATKQ